MTSRGREAVDAEIGDELDGSAGSRATSWSGQRSAARRRPSRSCTSRRARRSGASPRPARNASASRSKSSGRSSDGMWATSGQISRRAPGTSAATRSAASSVAGWSSSPTSTSVGQRELREAGRGRRRELALRRGVLVPLRQLERLALHRPDERPNGGIDGVPARAAGRRPRPAGSPRRPRPGRPGRAPRPRSPRRSERLPGRRRRAPRPARRGRATRPPSGGRAPPRPRSRRRSRPRSASPGRSPARRAARADPSDGTTGRSAAAISPNPRAS